MSNTAKLIEAMKIINKAKINNEEALQEKISLLRNIDLSAEAIKQNNVSSLIENLNDDEKEKLDNDMDDLAFTYSSILNSVADCLENPELRTKIVDEFKRRLG
tara:strand:- start:142 stop:450 length:309 start_codon:yes stop_codon:yes gene_type:complete